MTTMDTAQEKPIAGQSHYCDGHTLDGYDCRNVVDNFANQCRAGHPNRVRTPEQARQALASYRKLGDPYGYFAKPVTSSPETEEVVTTGYGVHGLARESKAFSEAFARYDDGEPVEFDFWFRMGPRNSRRMIELFQLLADANGVTLDVDVTSGMFNRRVDLKVKGKAKGVEVLVNKLKELTNAR